MTWLTDSYDITGWYLLLCMGLAGLATWAVMAERVRVAQEDRRRARRDACARGAWDAAFARRCERTTAGGRRPPAARRPAVHVGPSTDELRAWGWLRVSSSTSWRPTTAELHELVQL